MLLLLSLLQEGTKMKVCKCDRCGCIFEPHSYNTGFYSRVIQLGEETFSLMDMETDIDEAYDICDSCYEDFQRWFKRGALKGIDK